MKSKILVLIIMLQSIQFSFGQVASKTNDSVSKDDLVGVWQFSSPKIGGGVLESFKFFKDGRFVYTFDPVTDNKKIVSMKGTFRIDKNKLCLKVSSLTEVVGGDIVSGAMGTDLDLFVVDKAIIKERKISLPNELDALFITAIDVKGKSLMINNKKFFKLTSDPNKVF